MYVEPFRTVTAIETPLRVLRVLPFVRSVEYAAVQLMMWYAPISSSCY
jgi:hypothetical protein